MSTHGVVFLDKPLGWTSRKAVNEVMRIFSEPGKKRIKAGHGGTLDPLATGMLPILLGDATRFAELGLQAEKRYTVSFDLAYQTDTLDCEGEVSARFEVNMPEKAELQSLLHAFTGEQEQVPPLYSAIRVDGQRAHAIARQGGEVKLQARDICIHHLELLEVEGTVISLDVRCSKGTYIRSLARDIGEKLGGGGCVTALRRTSTGGWPEAMMVSMAQLQENPQAAVLPLRQWLRGFPEVCLPQDEARRFLNGQRIPVHQGEAGQVCVMCDGQMLGTAILKAGTNRAVLHPLRILPSAQKQWLA